MANERGSNVSSSQRGEQRNLNMTDDAAPDSYEYDGTGVKSIDENNHEDGNRPNSGTREDREARPTHSIPFGAQSVGDSSQDICLDSRHHQQVRPATVSQPLYAQNLPSLDSGHRSSIQRNGQGNREVLSYCGTDSSGDTLERNQVFTGNCLTQEDNAMTDSHHVRLAMNIPPSFHEPVSRNSTSCQMAMAEGQPSFRTLSTRISSLPSINPYATGQQDIIPHRNQPCHQLAITQPYAHESGIRQQLQTAPSGTDPMEVSTTSYPLKDAEPFLSIEDNAQNISVSPALGNSSMTARPVQGQRPSAHGNSVGHNKISDSRVSAGAAAPSSSSSSIVNSRTFINQDVKVIKLPRSVLKLVSQHLEVDIMTGTWKDLVELHGWNYERTYLFDNRNHRNGLFCALLHEPEFQGYTLGQLRADLVDMPRLDLLEDLDEEIQMHNSRVSASVSGNMRNLAL